MDDKHALLTQRVSDLEAKDRTAKESRAAMLNVLDDALSARKRAEELNRELQQRQTWLRMQQEALEAAVNGSPLETSLGHLISAVTRTMEPAPRAAFYLADAAGTTLRHVVGMSSDYGVKVNGFKIGPDSLACGLATHTGAPVITPDVQTAPCWEPWRWLAERFNYRGCWSFPIQTAAGKRVGTLAIYSQQPREATEKDLEMAGLVTKTACLIISQFTESEIRRQAEEGLQIALQETEKARAQAEAAGKSKDQFFAVLSHELRTPLTPVVMATRTLLHHTDLPADVRDGLTMIERNIQTESRMIDELLDLTRLEHGKMELHRERMDVQEALRHALQVVAPDTEAKRQNLITELASESARIDGDSMRLEQAFWNVLKNASKFTPEAGEIRVASKIEDNRLTITVSDSGAGIPKGALESIFEPFSQADSSIAKRFGGLGLGLALSRAIVDAHGGNIVAASDGNDQGASFTINLPLTA